MKFLVICLTEEASDLNRAVNFNRLMDAASRCRNLALLPQKPMIRDFQQKENHISNWF